MFTFLNYHIKKFTQLFFWPKIILTIIKIKKLSVYTQLNVLPKVKKEKLKKREQLAVRQKL